MKLGAGEIFLILIVILFVVGPDRIPEFARKFGEALKSFRAATSGMTKEIRENVIEPLNEAQAPLREALEPLNEMKSDLNSLASDMKHDLEGVGSEMKKEVDGITGEISSLGQLPETAPAPNKEEPQEEADDAATACLEVKTSEDTAPENKAPESVPQPVLPVQEEKGEAEPAPAEAAEPLTVEEVAEAAVEPEPEPASVIDSNSNEMQPKEEEKNGTVDPV